MHGYPPDGVAWPDYPSQSPEISFHLEPTSSSGGKIFLNIQSISKPYAETVKQEPSKLVSEDEIGNYVAGQWLDVVLAAKFDYRPEYGRTRVWLNGTSAFDEMRGNYFNGHGQPFFWYGLYTGWRNRADVTRREIYFDEYRVAVGVDGEDLYSLVAPAQTPSSGVTAPLAPLNLRATV